MKVWRRGDGKFVLEDDGIVVDVFATEAEAQAELAKCQAEMRADEFLTHRMRILMADAAENFPQVDRDTLFRIAEEALKDAR